MKHETLIRRSVYAVGCAVAMSCSVAIGCAANADTAGAGGAQATGSPSSTASSASTSSSSSSTGELDAGSGVGGGMEGPLLIYAHTDDTLFRLDPESDGLTLTQVGTFDCVADESVEAMTDFAVDKSEKLWGISAYAVHALLGEGTSVQCGQQIGLQGLPQDPRFYGLTFAPIGVIDPAKEVLVAGNTQGQLWAVGEGGALTLRGNFGTVPDDDGQGHDYAVTHRGELFALSGDIVFLANNGSPVGFATVRDCADVTQPSTCNEDDTLIEIDVSKLSNMNNANESVRKSIRGKIVKREGCADGTTGAVGEYGHMYGIAAWKDKVYGFSRKGNIVEIDTDDGTACGVVANTGKKFAGAGVTTLAPIVPVPE